MIALDTNELSELAKPEPAASALEWLAGHRRAELCTMAVSEAEIAYGLPLLPRGRRRDELTLAARRRSRWTRVPPSIATKRRSA